MLVVLSDIALCTYTKIRYAHSGRIRGSLVNLRIQLYCKCIFVHYSVSDGSILWTGFCYRRLSECLSHRQVWLWSGML